MNHGQLFIKVLLWLSLVLRVSPQAIGSAQISKLGQSPAGMGKYFPTDWASTEQYQSEQGPLSLSLAVTSASPFAQGAYLAGTSSFVYIYFPFNFVVTGFLVLGNVTRTSNPGRVTTFQAGQLPTKSQIKTTPVYVTDIGGNPKLFNVDCTDTSSPCQVLLNSATTMETQLVAFLPKNCQSRCILQLDVIGYPSPTACPAIPTADYSMYISKNAQETMVQLSFSKVYYVTTFTVHGLSDDNSFWMSYQLVDGEPFANLTYAWNQSLWTFPVTYADEKFIVPFFLTPLKVQLHFSAASVVSSVDSLSGCPIDMCPPGWLPSTSFCWMKAEASVSWPDANQFCTGQSWGGVRGRLLDAKTAMERSLVIA